MKVRTIHPEELEQLSLLLAEQVKDSGFVPDCLVGIREGGALVCQLMSGAWPEAAVMELSVSRPGSDARKSHAFLRHIPLCLADFLRRAESRRLALRLRRKAVPTRFSPGFEIDQTLGLQTLGQKVCGSHPLRVLLVDDALDSGATLLCARRQIESCLPSVELKTAVLTVTQSHPLTEADFSLYQGILLRFPFSSDYRQ